MSVTSPNGPAPFLTSLNAGTTDSDSIVSSNTATQAYPTIPIEDDPTPADTGGFGLVSDVADFAQPVPGIQPTTSDPTGVAQQWGKDLAFDWTTGEPVGLVSGNLQYAIDDDEVLGWILKAIYTPQGRYAIYDVDYGTILNELRGEGGAESVIQSEIARTSQEALVAHARVVSATVDAVFREPTLAANAYFIVATLTLDSSDQPITLAFAT